ncbi:MAG: hypothetical protein QOF50_1507 [Gaiellaceae bacterium]|nr:hypothetical protein [Gaiellaceae bacterium]
MRRLVLLAPLLALAVAVAVPARGDGCAPATCGFLSGALPGGNVLAIRIGGQRGPLLAFDVRRAARAFTLPAGMISADGRHYFTSRPRKTETTLGAYDPQHGLLLNVWSIADQWILGAVAPHGGRIVLFRPAGVRPGSTRFAVVDTARGDVLRTFRLRGMYEVEALSPDGRRIYLVHWRQADYVLEVYDLVTRTLRANPPALEDGKREKMVGTAWIGLPAPDGRMVYTLYVEDDGSTFVHALDLTGKAPHCIDLPGGPAGTVDSGMASLVLSPDGRRLYVASPRLGRVTVVDLRSMKVVRSVRFQRAPVAARTSPGAISPNGRTFYFSGEGQLWAYDTAYGRVRGPYDAPSGVLGLAFSAGGRRLVVVDGARKVTLRDAATGRSITR